MVEELLFGRLHTCYGTGDTLGNKGSRALGGMQMFSRENGILAFNKES